MPAFFTPYFWSLSSADFWVGAGLLGFSSFWSWPRFPRPSPAAWTARL